MNTNNLTGSAVGATSLVNNLRTQADSLAERLSRLGGLAHEIRLSVDADYYQQQQSKDISSKAPEAPVPMLPLELQFGHLFDITTRLEEHFLALSTKL